MGVGYIWSIIMAVGIMFLRESPRWEYRKGRLQSARTTIAKSYGVPENHWEVDREIREVQAKLDAENAGGGKHPFWEVFTGPRMMYRVLLGVSMQALQQLTGANFFFYYGTTIFTATGLDDSFQTAMILGGINFAMTIPGTFVVERFGRRRALITGGLWMFVCFLIFASVGHFALDQVTPQNTPEAGSAMIAFACLFIAGYAMTWAPIVWAIVGELYPTRYRAQAMGLATASNWIWVSHRCCRQIFRTSLTIINAELPHLFLHPFHHWSYRLPLRLCLRSLQLPRLRRRLLLPLRDPWTQSRRNRHHVHNACATTQEH